MFAAAMYFFCEILKFPNMSMPRTKFYLVRWAGPPLLQLCGRGPTHSTKKGEGGLAQLLVKIFHK